MCRSRWYMHAKGSLVNFVHMPKRLDHAVALLKTLPGDGQERAASVLMAFAEERSSHFLDDDQLAGIDHAMIQPTVMYSRATQT